MKVRKMRQKAMQQNNYELSVCVGGRPLREYGHKGLTYVEGRQGHLYTIRFRNNTAARVLAVVSIDCLDVVDGKPATNESRGYVVPGYQSFSVKGWRTSKKKVNTFIFGTKSRANSTQSQDGDDTNCGIVAVKVFSEHYDLNAELNSILRRQPIVVHEHHHHPAPHYWNPWQPSIIYGGIGVAGGSSGIVYGCNIQSGTLQSGMGSPMLSGTIKSTSAGMPTINNSCNFISETPPKKEVQDIPNFNLGTGWGGSLEDEVEEVKFKRGSELATLEIYYSDEPGLRAAGIEVDKKPAVSKPTLPKAFHGFCTPPVVTST